MNRAYILDAILGSTAEDYTRLVRGRPSERFYLDLTTTNYFGVSFNRHNLFTFLSFSHLYHLLLGQVASSCHRFLAFKLVSMATDWAIRRATDYYNDAMYPNCQHLCDRMGVCITTGSNWLLIPCVLKLPLSAFLFFFTKSLMHSPIYQICLRSLHVFGVMVA